MKHNPIVSVIIPTYKRSDYLTRAIDSALNQTYPNIEVIVIDDNDPASPYREKTESVMEAYRHNQKVTYIKHPKNLNGSVARNTGIRSSRGDYIAFLDDDDEFMPDKLAAQVKKMGELDASWGACYCGYLKVMRDASIQKSSERREGRLLKEALARTLFAYGGSNFLVRRNVVLELEGFDETFRRNQDLEFLVRLLVRYKIAYVEGYLVKIHYDCIVTSPTVAESDEIDRWYLSQMDRYIGLLDRKEQKKVYSMVKLDRAKHLLADGRYSQAIKEMMDDRTDIVLIIRYIFYLAGRKVTRRSYGFKI